MPKPGITAGHMHSFAGAGDLEVTDPVELHKVKPIAAICDGRAAFEG